MEPHPDCREVAEALCRCISASHAANIAHCDVRRSNIVRFPTGLQLIDYGLSCKIGGEQILEKESRQAQCAGYRVAKLVAEIGGGVRKMTGGTSDDYEMIVKCLLDLIAS